MANWRIRKSEGWWVALFEDRLIAFAKTFDDVLGFIQSQPEIEIRYNLRHSFLGSFQARGNLQVRKWYGQEAV